MDKRQAMVAELPGLRRYARALLRDADAADDLVQDCLERALSRLHLFHAGTNMRAWLFTIMHNVFVNTVVRGRKIVTGALADGELENRHASPPEQNGSLVLRDLARALEQVPAEQREVVLLVGLEDMSYREAAEVLGVPVGTVMSRLSRGREHLRRLTGNGGAPSLRRVK